MKRLENYRGIVDDEILADLHRRAARLFDRSVAHINSSAYGGGVAEILESLVPLMNDAGVKTEWHVLLGEPDFFNVTKKFHNGLQGERLRLNQRKKSVYLETNEAFSQFTHLEDVDVVAIHDPQPLPIVRFYRKRQPWVWRCHVDLSAPDPELWDYLKGFVLQYDLVVVSHESYLHPDLPVPQVVVHPAIDPLSKKNLDLDENDARGLLTRLGVPLDRPIVSQVSRFDRWKDPLGVIDVFRRVRQNADCRLVLAGNVAIDDPESGDVYAKARAAAADLIDSTDVIFLTGADNTEINALQRTSAVVLQKSLREGFGLTVAEAQWKGTPVVASAVGGIPLQLTDGETGFLVNPSDHDRVAERVVTLLEDPDRAASMGAAGREHVRRNFLMTRLLGHWLSIVREQLEAAQC